MELNDIIRSWFESLLPTFGWAGTWIISTMLVVLAYRYITEARIRREEDKWGHRG